MITKTAFVSLVFMILTSVPISAGVVSSESPTSDGSSSVYYYDTYSESASESKSESVSESMSESFSESYVTNSVTFLCTNITTVTDKGLYLDFPASEFMNVQTCKGEKYLHNDNKKNWIGHPKNLPNRRWMSRRNCTCPEYRVCYNRRCTHLAETFTAHILLDQNYNYSGTLDCQFVLPYSPFMPLYPLYVYADNEQLALNYSLSRPRLYCDAEFVGPNGTTTLPAVTVSTPSAPVRVPNFTFPIVSVACTLIEPVEIITETLGFLTLAIQCETDPFNGCVDIVAPTSLDYDVNLSSCSHVRTSGTPLDGAGKITGFVFAGLAALAIIALLIWFCIAMSSKDAFEYTELHQR